eukprot:3957863-Amphidinium_carterae.1
MYLTSFEPNSYMTTNTRIHATTECPNAVCATQGLKSSDSMFLHLTRPLARAHAHSLTHTHTRTRAHAHTHTPTDGRMDGRTDGLTHDSTLTSSISAADAPAGTSTPAWPNS